MQNTKVHIMSTEVSVVSNIPSLKKVPFSTALKVWYYSIVVKSNLIVSCVIWGFYQEMVFFMVLEDWIWSFFLERYTRYIYSILKVEFVPWTDQDIIQRVPALRGFWDLEKTVLHETRVVVLYFTNGFFFMISYFINLR